MTLAPERAGLIEVSDGGVSLVVRLPEDLDSLSHAKVGSTVLVAFASCTSVILDLCDVSFCDSHGLRMFIAAHQAAAELGTMLALRNMRPQVRRVFTIVGLDLVMNIGDEPG